MDGCCRSYIVCWRQGSRCCSGDCAFHTTSCTNSLSPNASHARYCASACQDIDQQQPHCETAVSTICSWHTEMECGSQHGTEMLSLSSLSNLHLQDYDNMPTLNTHYDHSFQAVFGFLFVASPAWRWSDKVSYLSILWQIHASYKESPLLLAS